MKPDKQSLLDCHRLIEPHVHRTPVLSSRSLNDMTGAALFFKCENFQRSGSFKIRGATHAILQLTDPQRATGVVAHSSGNFAQALALAARNVGISACIAMPSNASKVKVDATQAFGGEIIFCPPTAEDRERVAQQIVERRGATFIHPSNDLQVILGQATVAVELFEEQADLDYLFVPVGGGGLIAGCALAAVHCSDHCRTIGAEPLAVDDAFRSLASGHIEHNETTQTIADGLKTNLGDLNFPIIRQHVEQIVPVSEQEIVDAMRLIWDRLKIVIEPSSAVAFAAVQRERPKLAGRRVGVILSGGNVDLERMPFANGSVFKTQRATMI